jgi:acyl dehydratase
MSERGGDRYFEDIPVGFRFKSASVTVTAEAIKAFAGQFDPQVFHLDEEGARGTFFGRLVASGWHTAALTMRLLVESDLHPAGGTIGAGTDEMRWPKPVYPDDVLHAEGEVLDKRLLRSRPDVGLIRARVTTYNGAGEPVQIFNPALLIRRREG